MLDWKPRCKPMKFVGGKSKRMIGRSGSPVRNHWLIDVGHGVALQSYNSIVAFKFTKCFGRFNKGDVILDRYTWNYSPTTARYLRLFLGEGKKATEAKIATGEYRVEVLNLIHTLDNLIRPTDFY